MLIDFRNITIKNIEGEESTVDISKDLGNLLYNSAVSQEGLEISRELYHNGERDVTNDYLEVRKGIIMVKWMLLKKMQKYLKALQLVTSQQLYKNL